eukprot:COSAG02_NODE_54346_length_296_cov_1.248731_1_plen_21_part_10
MDDREGYRGWGCTGGPVSSSV